MFGTRGSRAFLALALVASACGGDGSGDTADGDGEFLGSCTGPATAEGVYGCVSLWQLPEEGSDHGAIWRSVCVNDTEGTFSGDPCPGGHAGCCTIGVATVETKRKRECYYGVQDTGPLATICTGFGGTWE